MPWRARGSGPAHFPHCLSRSGGTGVRGFTLIELLVVIAIISLLASILAPSVHRAMELAKQTACLSNLKSIGVGISMYVDDADGRLMPYTILTNSHWHRWYNRLVPDPDVFPYNTSDYLSVYDVLFCPSHRLGPSGDPANFPRPRDWAAYRGLVSYGMSMGSAVDYGAPGYPETPCDMDRVEQPSRTVLVTEGAYPAYDWGGYYFVAPYFAPAIPVVAARHVGAAAVLWMDYHVAAVRATSPADPASIYHDDALTTYASKPTYWDRN